MATKVADIHQEVQELREALGLSQEDFARLLGVSVRTISRWESGASLPHPLAMKELARWRKALEHLQEVFKPTAIPQWFHQPNKALGDKTPFDVACGPDGDVELLDLLGRIEWGIPS
ncbi:helix-turn-helix domain-containing protein [Candidatus Acetothermia bacterium]|nr:helix-turn-helix domain-containing protein [Candidatus Acetothermia bacterium]MCI2431462.1 helix-turn-helix domain-containing protein [Candidatus Acetothermia bacterium]MCI2436424.1 helix-turn-helix domain-containing protein [Candidatus Acetothermia bacterium]